MKKPFALFLALYALGTANTFAAKSPIIRPDPADFSLISGFQPEWCSTPQSSGPAPLARICYGRARFQQMVGIRSILVERKGASAELYIESEWPKVELFKPRFEVVGPVTTIPGRVSELGQCAVSFDASGEVESLILWTPSLGMLRAAR